MTHQWPPDPDAVPSALDRLDPFPARNSAYDPRFDYIPGGTE